MAAITRIAEHPPSEWYALDGEIDYQCARCGSSCHFIPCDALWCDENEWSEEGDQRPCDECGGYGGWQQCLSSPEYCQENPLPGRADVARGAIEWFVVEIPQPKE